MKVIKNAKDTLTGYVLRHEGFLKTTKGKVVKQQVVEENLLYFNLDWTYVMCHIYVVSKKFD